MVKNNLIIGKRIVIIIRKKVTTTKVCTFKVISCCCTTGFIGEVTFLQWGFEALRGIVRGWLTVWRWAIWLTYSHLRYKSLSIILGMHKIKTNQKNPTLLLHTPRHDLEGKTGSYIWTEKKMSHFYKQSKKKSGRKKFNSAFNDVSDVMERPHLLRKRARATFKQPDQGELVSRLNFSFTWNEDIYGTQSDRSLIRNWSV